MAETEPAAGKRKPPTKSEFIEGLPKPSKDEFIFVTGHGMKKQPYPAGMLPKMIPDPINGDRDQFSRFMEKLADPMNLTVIAIIDSSGEIKEGSDEWKAAVKRTTEKKIEQAKQRAVRADPWTTMAKILERTTA